MVVGRALDGVRRIRILYPLSIWAFFVRAKDVQVVVWRAGFFDNLVRITTQRDSVLW